MLKNNKKVLSIAAMASLLITSSASAVNVKAAAVTPPESPRLWGADRYETAVKVSQVGWTTSDYAVIASGEGYADALCAAPLAKANNAPILLTQKDKLSASTLSELKRLNVKHVYIIGGQGVVSQSVENAIKSQVTSDIQRIWGQDRYETSVKVAQKLGATSKIVLASGEGYADALSAAPMAAIEGMPILLTESKTLSTPTANYIKGNASITKTFVIGGYASVSDATMNMVPNAQRFGGADRYETNAKVLDAFSSDFNYNNVFIALADGPSGNEFADALSGSALAAVKGNPVIITNKVITSTTQTFAKSKLSPSSTITVLGGVANVPDSVVSNIRISAAFLGEAGKTYSDTIEGNTDITADNVVLKGNVKGDLYLNGNNASISNITVDGTIYINPGVNGVANLDTVTAKNIVVLSGAKDSIHLKNVKSQKLTIQSRNNVRITSEGTTSIGATTVLSQAVLEATSGSFGTVNLAQTPSGITVELKGTFDKLITVNGEAKLNTDSTTNIEGLVLADTIKAADVTIEGVGTIKNIQVKNATVVLNIDKSIVITGTIEVVNKNNIKSENTNITSKVEEKSSGDMSNITPGGGATGGGGGGVIYTDITKSVLKAYGSKMQENLAAHPTLDKYVDLNTTGSAIEVKINSKWDTIEEMFVSSQKQDWNTFEPRAQVLKDFLNMNFVSNVKIGESSLKNYLISLYPSCFYNGDLEKGMLFDKLRNEELTYTIFNNNLIKKIEGDNKTAKGPGFKFVLAPKTISNEAVELAIDKLEKDGKTIYNSTWTREQNASVLTKDINYLAGNYTVYCGNNIIKLSVSVTNTK